jgi:hypothetical protein
LKWALSRRVERGSQAQPLNHAQDRAVLDRELQMENRFVMGDSRCSGRSLVPPYENRAVDCVRAIHSQCACSLSTGEQHFPTGRYYKLRTGNRYCPPGKQIWPARRGSRARGKCSHRPGNTSRTPVSTSRSPVSTSQCSVSTSRRPGGTSHRSARTSRRTGNHSARA